MSGVIRSAVVALIAVPIVLGVYVLVLRQDVPPWWVIAAAFLVSFAVSRATRAHDDAGVSR